MSKSTEKAGSSGRFGARYGVVVRNRTRDIDKMRTAAHECPSCHRTSVSRVSSGIWECSKCSTKFAAGAYSPLSKKETSEEIRAKAAAVESEEIAPQE
ncbi:50S ribosomal protein L37ae [Methanomassiliicoccus luminyensis]|uniref:50S ribosomal protein L37ae n=1 Tax=Methanomassiliicoccus luminyensis TaxID=1080712 RepID=UPI00035CB23F|nr:50S ribosomal protein L37ae [Methanomassiliicoccus luminyensis]